MRLLVDTLSSMKELEKKYVFWFGNGSWVDHLRTLTPLYTDFKTISFRLINRGSRYMVILKVCVCVCACVCLFLIPW